MFAIIIALSASISAAFWTGVACYGVAFMAFGAGVGRDALGTYLPAFLLAGVLCLAAAAAFGLVRKPATAPA